MTAQAKPVAARPGLVLAVLAVGGSVFAILQSLVVPALPVLQHDLHASPTGVAWIFTIYLLVASIATPIAGRLGDMFGKKRVLVLTLVALALGALVAALATTLPVLILARAIQGLGGGFFPLAFGIIRDEFPRERVPGGIGLISGLVGIGAGIGIVVAGPILAHLNYHWLFWIPLAALVPATIATIVVVPESPIRAPGYVDIPGALLLSLWLVFLLVAISEGSRWGWLSLPTISLLLSAVVAALAWVALETRTPNPLVDMRMMRLRGVWTANLAALLVGVGMYASFVLIPQFVETPSANGYGFGSSVTAAGFFLLPSSLMMLVSAPFAGRLAGRFGSKVPLVAGTIICVAAFAFLTVAHSEPWQVYLGSFLIGTGIGFSFSSLVNVIVEAVRPDQTGVATGMNAVMRTIGGAVGSQVVASILAAGLLASGLPEERGYTISFALMGIALVGAVAASLAVPRRRPRRAHVVAAGAQVSVE
jgi:EmrB/QacA subfamily drug resistance transporter